MAKWLFGKRTFFLFKQTSAPAVAGQAIKAADTKGNVQYETLPGVAENVEKFDNPAAATAEQCATKINAIIDALVAAGLMDDAVS